MGYVILVSTSITLDNVGGNNTFQALSMKNNTIYPTLEEAKRHAGTGETIIKSEYNVGV